MSERQYAMPHDLPVATTPMVGTELAMFEQGGQLVQAPYSALTGDVAEHAEKHQIDGEDPIGTLDNIDGAIPYLDTNGMLDSRVSDASTTTKGKVQLATDGEVSAIKAVTGTDARLSDARAPTAHASQHIAGTDVIANATVSNSGLMSATDKVKADATIPAYIPTEDQKAALAGTSGVPSAGNPFVTKDDIGVGVCPLENGLVPSSNLPSYVDDVLEYANEAAFPAIGETGKIYVALDVNLTFRWSGSAYVEISKSLALGETSATAYRGDRGKTAYDHSQSAHAPADADNTQTAINSASEKTTPVDGDAFPVLDSAASNALKKTTLANVKAVLKGYFDGFYSGGGGGGSTGVDLLGIGEIGTGLSVGVVGQPVLTALNSTDVAFIDSYNGELRCYTFNGANWIQKGNGLSIASVGRTKGLAGLNSTDVALTDGDNGELRCYTFDGTNWTQKGNGLSIASVGHAHALASLNSTDVAFIDSAEKELRCYTFDGTSWSQVGTGLSVSGVYTPALTALNSTDIAFIDGANKELRVYRFNGTAWSQVGTGLAISGAGNSALATLNSTDVAFIDASNDELRTYRFNGTSWSQVGTGLSISGVTSPALAALNSTDVAFKGATNEKLRTYRFLFGYDSASVNISADYEVPEIDNGKSIIVRRTSAYDGNPVTITPPPGATFEGLASISLYGQYSYVELERISATVFAIKECSDRYYPAATTTVIREGKKLTLNHTYNFSGDISTSISGVYNSTAIVLTSFDGVPTTVFANFARASIQVNVFSASDETFFRCFSTSGSSETKNAVRFYLSCLLAKTGVTAIVDITITGEAA